MSDVKQIERVAVWDPVVRYGHWTLVAGFAIAYLSAEEESDAPNILHLWGGYAVGLIVALRVLWGFVGPRHARFTDFVCGPVTALRYLLDLASGRARRYVGHSPAGGLMAVTLLFLLAATVGTGLVAYGDRGKAPLPSATSVVSMARADDEAKRARDPEADRDRTENLFGEVHGTLANVTLLLVVVHILGVGLASFVHRENLIESMMSGQKRAEG